MKSWILIALLIAAPAQAGTQQFDYSSPHVNLRYTFTTASGVPDGAVDSFEIISPAGPVRGEIATLPDGSERITLLDGESFTTAEVDVTDGSSPGSGEIVLELSDAGLLRFEYDDRRQSVGPATGARSSPLRCAELSRSAVYKTLVETFIALNQDVDSHYPNVPPHLVRISAAVGLARGLPGLVAKCKGSQDPLAGGCYYDHVSFGSCSGCCQNAGSLGGLCTMLISCPDLSCRTARVIVCGGIRHLAVGGCILHNCRGKPGDPNCTEPKPPCPGTCMEFCGPGHSSTCGACPDGLDCCYP